MPEWLCVKSTRLMLASKVSWPRSVGRSDRTNRSKWRDSTSDACDWAVGDIIVGGVQNGLEGACWARRTPWTTYFRDPAR